MKAQNQKEHKKAWTPQAPASAAWNSLDPDQVFLCICPDLGLSCFLKKLILIFSVKWV